MIRPWTIGVWLAIFCLCIASTVQKEAMDSPNAGIAPIQLPSLQCYLSHWPILQGIPKQLLFILCTSFSALCMRSSAATPTIYTRRWSPP
ncbi:uncharacterized protein BDZ83DRAFT_316571 [Colletotrichum acutatum]|uniref:Uncharacterized protein n=1 Tax=Glomerella acutata TaxID=27357 RepID=A0AAD8XEQ9_GLOAC|nr:uncharacterized protein BDZ83DRAFT_316571 [Colletotrichum acutatum]KAK1725039.1 hypothetical protein BDZ83DRAFT_316571 [Colletotrichum acutatum]